MRILKTRAFASWARRSRISDTKLKSAIDEMSRGLAGNHLSGILFKKRIAGSSGGKRGGSRVILLYRKNKMAVFLYGFDKNSRSNIKQNELVALKAYANIL